MEPINSVSEDFITRIGRFCADMVVKSDMKRKEQFDLIMDDLKGELRKFVVADSNYKDFVKHRPVRLIKYEKDMTVYYTLEYLPVLEHEDNVYHTYEEVLHVYRVEKNIGCRITLYNNNIDQFLTALEDKMGVSLRL
jgi:hypothetical protein